MEYVAACIIGYLLGSIPVAGLVAGRYGVDLLSAGDGNPGAWNALEQLGLKRAWPVFAGDTLKGALAGGAGLLLGDVWTGYAAVAAAMLGHAFPLFAGFRGGTAVLTFAGGMLAVAPMASALAIACVAIVALVLPNFAWSARIGIFGFPLVQLTVDPVTHVIATGALMALIGVRFLMAGGVADRLRSGDVREQPREG